MRKPLTESVDRDQGRICARILIIPTVALMLAIAAPCTLFAQQVPPRAYQLQDYQLITPPPPSNADRVRQDVIRATNPYTGTVNVRVLQQGASVEARPWLSPGVPGSVSQGGASQEARTGLKQGSQGELGQSGPSMDARSGIGRRRAK
jgi:hypothetical protein